MVTTLNISFLNHAHTRIYKTSLIKQGTKQILWTVDGLIAYEGPNSGNITFCLKEKYLSFIGQKFEHPVS